MTAKPTLDWLLMVDGVLNRFGHTGTWFGYQYAGVLPDVLTQGLRYRLPTGTCLPQGTAADPSSPGDHGPTLAESGDP